MQLRQKAIDLSSSSVDREIVEDEIRMEMQRMREDDIDEVEQHPPITWKEHEEAFRDLVPVASQETDKVLRWALRLAYACGLRIPVLTAWRVPPGRKRLESKSTRNGNPACS